MKLHTKLIPIFFVTHSFFVNTVIQYEVRCERCWRTLQMKIALHLTLAYVICFSAGVDILKRITGITNTIVDEVEYRKHNLQVYKQEIQSQLSSSIQRLSHKQQRLIHKAQNELNIYSAMCNTLYKEALSSSKQKQRILDQLNLKVERSKKFDDSLETFRNFHRKKYERNQQHRLQWKHFGGLIFQLFGPVKFAAQRLTQHASDFIIIDGPRFTELKFEQSLQELTKIQEDFTAKLRTLNYTSISTFPVTVSKEDMRRARLNFEKQLKLLETESNLWVEERVKRIESAVREWQAKVMQRERALDDLVNMRQTAMQYTQLSDDTLVKVLDLIDPKAEGWNEVKSESGVTVYRKLLHPSSAGSQYACVKCHGVVKASPQRLYQLLTDTSRAKEYNTLYNSGREIATVSDDTKVVHSTSVSIFPFKPRDFVYLVHRRQLRDGTMVVLNRATDHASAPKQQPGYIRGSILLAAHIIQPVLGKLEHSKLTMITQVDPGGFAPPSIINQICTLGPIGFMKSVEVAANK